MTDRPKVIEEMKSLWTGIYVKDGQIYNQNHVLLGTGAGICPFCTRYMEFSKYHGPCIHCPVKKTFGNRHHFRNMKRERLPCHVLIRRIIKSRRPQGLLHSYLKQIEERMIRNAKKEYLRPYYD